MSILSWTILLSLELLLYVSNFYDMLMIRHVFVLDILAWKYSLSVEYTPRLT